MGIERSRKLPCRSRIALPPSLGIPGVEPLRVPIVVVAAGDEVTARLREPESLAGMAGERNRAPVLHRNAEDLRPACGANGTLIREGGDEERPGRSPLTLGGLLGRVDLRRLVDPRACRQKREVLVLDVVGQLSSRTIEPHVADHSVRRRMSPGGQSCMADDRLRIGMLVVSVGVVDTALVQISEPARLESIEDAIGLIAAELIDGDLQHQANPRLRRFLMHRRRFSMRQ